MPSPQKDAMLYIWEAVTEKKDDGQWYIVWENRHDLEYLYSQGFVDTDKFTLEEWVKAFDDTKRPNGQYWVTLKHWVLKRPFRYEGPVEAPFDPFTLREGEWTKGDFQEILRQNILPATSLKEKDFESAFLKFKDKLFKDDKLLLTADLKKGFLAILQTYPSPRRNREMAVLKAKQNPGSTNTPSLNQAQKNQAASSFKQGPSPENTAKKKLEDLFWKGGR